MRYVTTIVWQVGAMRRLGQWLVLLSIVLSGRAFAGGESGIGGPTLENGSAIPLKTRQAAEFWVSPWGDDRGPGSRDRPFQTIQRGVNAAAAGDTVFVRAGHYEEHVKVSAPKSGALHKWITICAAPGEERQPIVGTEEPRIDVSGSDSSAFALQGAKYVRIRGFRCVAPYRGRGSGIGARNCEHIEILNCVVSGGGQGGIDANQCNFVTIDGVEAFFNGGGTGWSSGISLLDLRSKENIVRNCIVYGNYDNSSYRTDGNGIIIDNGYTQGGALLINNLAFMNGGKGICSTRSDDCTFLNNTSVANCWQLNQQASAHELSIRGARNLVQNNIGVGLWPKAAGMPVLPEYSGPMGNVKIDPNTITCHHNLFFNPHTAACVVLAGDRTQPFTLAQLEEKMPRWAGASLSVDPGFVDAQNLDFRLRPDSPALKAGVTAAEATTDLLVRARAKDGVCSLGCYEGGTPTGPVDRPEPGVEIAVGQDAGAIQALLANRYDLDWHGMLWGWGKLLPEELPLAVEVLGPRKADFLNLSGSFVLGELLSRMAREHQVRLVLRQPADSKGLPAGPHTISRRLSICSGADANEQAFVRRCLRVCVWTQDDRGVIPFAKLAPALSAALGLRIVSEPPIPPERKFAMTTLNMPLDSFLTDLARRMDLRFTLSHDDPLADAARAQEAALDHPFGHENGVVELTVERPDGRGRIDLFARVQPKACLCARVFSNNSRFLSPAGIDDTGAGAMFHRADTRLDPGSTVRLAVVGEACALNVGGQWVVLNHLAPDLATGGFHVRVVSDWIKVDRVRFSPVTVRD